MVKLTKEGYDIYPQYVDEEISIIAEQEKRVRIKVKGKGERWIDRNLLSKPETEDKPVEPIPEEIKPEEEE